MVKISKEQSVRGHGWHTEELEPHSVAAILGVLSKEKTWFALQKSHPGSSKVCDGWEGQKQRQGDQLGVYCKGPIKRE